MPAKLLYFQRTAVKYSVLTGSGALIALDNTACSTNLIFHRGTTREKHASSSGWGDAVPRAVWQKVPGFVPAGWAPPSAAPGQRSPAGRAVTAAMAAMVTGLPILSAAPRAVAAPVTRAGKLKSPGSL